MSAVADEDALQRKYLGPYGDRDDQQVFVQKVVPFETNQIYVRFCSTGTMMMCPSHSHTGAL